MVPIQSETNIEVLRQYSLWLEDEVKKLNKDITSLRGAADESKQQYLNDVLRDQLTRLQKKFFGFGREARKSRPVGHTEEQLKLHGERVQEDTLHEESTGNEEKAAKPQEKVDYEFSEKELEMECSLREIYGLNPWGKMKDFYQESIEITVTERVYKKVVHRQAKYRLKDEFNKTGKEVIITAPGPVKVKPGSQYSVDFALSVVSDKYEYHLPLERQRRKMEAAGLDVDVKALYTLCESIAEHCESGVTEKIREDIFSDFCAAHLDESTWPIIGSDSASYMWALSNRVGSYFQFEPTRSGKIAEELLKGYKGSVLTDGFSGYNRIKNSDGIRLAYCWSHARREFYEREEDFSQEANEALDFIDELFSIEARAKTIDDLRTLRKTESKAVIEKFYKWLLETRLKFFPKDGIVSAIDYCLKLWPGLTLFLKDLSVPLSNNDAERALRHIVMGRKNFAGSKTINGADVAATLYTVIESAKKVGLQPKEYLKYVITEHWYKREPLSPAQLSIQKFGRNKRAVFPVKDQWEV